MNFDNNKKDKQIERMEKGNFTERWQGIFLTFVILIALAAALRFYKLGEWSFYMDELATQAETMSFFENRPIPEVFKQHYAYDPDPSKCQFRRLPCVLVAAYFVHWVDYRLFGDDEFGSRVLMAVMGTLNVGIVFLLGRSLFGYSGSLILAVLLMLSSEHLFYSQDSRFYIQAFLLSSTVLLLGGHIAVYRSVTAAVWLGPLSILMVLSCSLTGVIWGILLFGLLADFLFAKRTDTDKTPSGFPWKLALILGAESLVLLLIAAVHILPIMRGWNYSAFSSGPSPIMAVFVFARNILGWHYFVLAVFACFFTLFHLSKKGRGYWVCCALAAGAAVFFLPMKIPYFHRYSFLFAFPFFIFTALFMDGIRQGLNKFDVRYCRWGGLISCFLVLFLNLLGLVWYYYKDGGGDRYDFRAASDYIIQHWEPGDMIFVIGDHYEIEKYMTRSIPGVLPVKLDNRRTFNTIRDDESQDKERAWVVAARSGEWVRDWKILSSPDIKRAEYRASFSVCNYIGASKYLDVFLYTPPNKPQLTSEPRTK